MMYPSSGSADVAARAWTESRRSCLELAVVPAAVRIARLWTAEQLSAAGPPGPAGADLGDAAVLAVSELITNAIQAVNRVTAASQSPAAVIPDSTLTAPVLASNAFAGAARLAEAAGLPKAARLSEAPWPVLPGRILSFGDLPYGPGLPGPMMQAAARLPAPARVWLVIVRQTALVRIEVRDSSPAPLPPTCHRDADDETGRGLTVVAALAESWGWHPEAAGKVVWCELATKSGASGSLSIG